MHQTLLPIMRHINIFSMSPAANPFAEQARRRFQQGAFIARRLSSASFKYVTNHVISHIPVFALRHVWYRRVLGWDLGARAYVFMDQHIEMAGIRTSGTRVSIGAGTIIMRDCLLSTRGGLVIGENVSISQGVWLVTATHQLDDPEFADVYLPITIDDYAWIGTRATILSGVTVGRGAVVMAGAVVNEDVAAFAIVSGVPATTVGMRELRDPNYRLKHHPPLE